MRKQLYLLILVGLIPALSQAMVSAEVPAAESNLLRDSVLEILEQAGPRLGQRSIKASLFDIHKLAWSGDGSTLASFDLDGRQSSGICVWETRGLWLARTLPSTIHPQLPVTGLALDEKGERLAFGERSSLGGDDMIFICNLQQFGAPIERVIHVNDKISSLAWAPDGKLVRGHNAAGKVDVLDGVTGVVTRELYLYDSIDALAVNNRGNRIAAGSGTAVTDISEDSLPRNIALPEGSRALFVRWSEDVDTIIIGLSDGRIISANTVTGALHQKLKLPFTKILSMAQSSDGRIAMGGEAGTLHICANYTEVLKRYFAQEIAQLVATNELTWEQARSQMHMVWWLSGAYEPDRVLTPGVVVESTNADARRDITSVAALDRIRATFPREAKIALGHVFNEEWIQHYYDE